MVGMGSIPAEAAATDPFLTDMIHFIHSAQGLRIEDP
jgi:hypothetical protein